MLNDTKYKSQLDLESCRVVKLYDVITINNLKDLICSFNGDALLTLIEKKNNNNI